MTDQITRAAEILEGYAEFIKAEQADNLERHPYIPDINEAARILRAAAAVDVQLNVVAYRDGGTKRCSVTAPAYWVRPEPMVYLSEATEALIQKDLKIAALESALRLALAAREPRCACCGTTDVSQQQTCHNSACTEYACDSVIYQGWAAPKGTP